MSRAYVARLRAGQTADKKQRENKLTYAISRVQKALSTRCRVVEEEAEARQQDAAVEFAATYPADYEKKYLRGCLVVEDGRHVYTPEQNRKMREKNRQI